tara:strand:- start:302 stop:2992 length:2691 start_codon:yes stop_codon:yes gene_type:complete
MANVCLPNAKKMGEEIIKWSKSPLAKKTFRDPFEAALRLVNTEFLIPIEEIGLREVDITKGQLGSFKNRLAELDNLISRGTLDNAFSTTIWQTSKFGKKDPVIGSVLRNMQLSNFYFREHESTDKSRMNSIMKNLEIESINSDLINNGGFTKGQAQKELQKLDDRLQTQLVAYQNGESASLKEVNSVQKEMGNHVQKTYLKVFENLLEIIENKSRKGSISFLEKEKYKTLTPEQKKAVNDGKLTVKLTGSDLAKLTNADGTPVSKEMFKAIVDYKSLMDGLYSRLRNGVNAQIDGIISKVEMQKGEVGTERIVEMRKNLEAKLMPKYEGNGFFPHYTRDLNVDFMSGLMPRLDELNDVSNSYQKNKGKKTVSEAINSVNTFISEHTKTRGDDLQYSKNFLNSVTNYIYDVNRFNYTANMNKHMIKGLRDVESIYKTDGDAKGYAESVVNFIQDMHTASNGHSDVSPQTRAIMRTLLGFEFISKLGVNPRGAVRNFTQRMLDYVEWGFVQGKKTNETLSRLGLDNDFIEAELRRVGLYFSETSPQLLESEISGPASTFKSVEFNESTGKHQYVKKSSLEKMADKVGWAAGKASFLHRAAENSNRKHTFKTAFAQMYDWLDSPKYRQKLTETRGKDLTDKEVSKSIRTRARNYAVNMVVLNHFDYGDYAKSKLIRSKAGKFFGQFQHYSFEFLERNIKIMREAKHDMLAGKVIPGMDAQGISKTWRLAMAYFLAPVLASAYTGLDFTNIVEHDSAKRMQQIATVFMGDEEEINEAFYGKGPIISTFGGPITSDLIDIGMMLDLIDLDDDSLFKLIGGLEKYEYEDNAKIVRLLNSFAGRLVNQHLPALREGRIGWVAQSELSLYRSAEAKESKQKLDKVANTMMPDELIQAFARLEAP